MVLYCTVATAPPTISLLIYIGVLWLGSTDAIPGAKEAVSHLRALVHYNDVLYV